MKESGSCIEGETLYVQWKGQLKPVDLAARGLSAAGVSGATVTGEASAHVMKAYRMPGRLAKH